MVIVITTLDRQQSKKLILSTKARVRNRVLIAICRQNVDKWQSKTLFLAIFDLHSSIDKSV